jgi:hypothetical protein
MKDTNWQNASTTFENLFIFQSTKQIENKEIHKEKFFENKKQKFFTKFYLIVSFISLTLNYMFIFNKIISFFKKYKY